MSVGTSGYRPFYSHTSFIAAKAICPPSPNQSGCSQEEGSRPGRFLWPPLNFHNLGQQHVTENALSWLLRTPTSPLKSKIWFQANIDFIASNTLWQMGQKCNRRHTQAQGSTWCSAPSEERMPMGRCSPRPLQFTPSACLEQIWNWCQCVSHTSDNLDLPLLHSCEFTFPHSLPPHYSFVVATVCLPNSDARLRLCKPCVFGFFPNAFASRMVFLLKCLPESRAFSL